MGQKRGAQQLSLRDNLVVAEITETLRGKKLKQVYYDKDSGSLDVNTQDELELDGGNIYIEFEDGTLLEFWNSEWGGITIVNEFR
jgi:hypothetical protein